jgi:energy-coupling factor transport system ATP-binding protein
VLKAADLTFCYSGMNPGEKVIALKGVSFAVERGEVLGILGPIGAGKTTLCMSLAGFAPRLTGGELTGEISVAGLDPREASNAEVAHHVGYVFEDYSAQITQVKVIDEAMAPLLNRGVEPEEAETRARMMLERVGLGAIDADRKRTWELSGGQQQRVAIAATLAVDPEAIIFDSATGMLDPEGKEEVRSIMAELAGEKTLVVVENDADFVVGLADRLLVLDGGTVCASGPSEEILRDGDVLSRAGVDPPVALRFARALGLEQSPLTVEEAARYIGGIDVKSAYMNGKANGNSQVFGRKAGGPGGSLDDNGFGEPVVRVEGATFRYPDGTVAVEDVNLVVRRGEAHALIGGNGAGKTTLAKMIFGVNKPSEGKVTVAGVDTRETTATDLAWKVGTAFQNPDEQISERTVAEEIAFPLKCRRYERTGWFKKRELFDEARIAERVKRARELSELEDELLGHDPSLMPGGQRRLVTATSALVLDPDVVVLDEPRVGLDAESRRKIERMIGRLREMGKAVILIDHDMDLICEVADTVTVLNQGRVALHGPTEEVFAKRNWDTLAEMYIRPPRAALLADMLDLDALSFDELGSRLVAVGEGEA